MERDSLTVLVMGKGGVGKSSTVNSIIGERAVAVSSMATAREWVGIQKFPLATQTKLLEILGTLKEKALELIKRFLLNKTIDVLLYVDRLDSYRVDNLDKQIVKLTPPDCLSYEDFFARRSEAILKVIDSGAGAGVGARFRKREVLGNAIPVALVENSTRCNKNDGEEKILPNGTSWIPSIVKTIAEVATNESKSILVDQKLIDGPNANERGKMFIPLLAAFQYFFVVKRVQSWIKDDIAKAPKSSWE
nr:translocase of chloroplast 34, chloroplastic [Tanacetum cinerariifolium]